MKIATKRAADCHNLTIMPVTDHPNRKTSGRKIINVHLPRFSFNLHCWFLSIPFALVDRKFHAKLRRHNGGRCGKRWMTDGHRSHTIPNGTIVLPIAGWLVIVGFAAAAAHTSPHSHTSDCSFPDVENRSILVVLILFLRALCAVHCIRRFAWRYRHIAYATPSGMSHGLVMLREGCGGTKNNGSVLECESTPLKEKKREKQLSVLN